MKQPYVESKKHEPFNWFEFLSKENYSYGELSSALFLSKNWITCACGQQCSVIERLPSGEPKDYYLAYLGQIFHNAIKGMHYFHQLELRPDDLEEYSAIGSFNNYLNLAILILLEIEHRSTELIKEIQK
jgi:hypothetical protein